MEIAKLTSKGQLTLPITIRRHLGVDCGDKIAFVEKNGEYILVNIDRLTLTERNSSMSIDNVAASMDLEGFEVGEEHKKYMYDRLAGKITIEDRIEHMNKKYGARDE